MTKVFLSYDRDDRASARKIVDALEQSGHSVWWDHHIRGGAQFSEKIDQALGAAEAVVVLWSKRSIASPWVRDEAAAGRDSGRLVPIRIDGCSPPLGFRQYQTIDLPNLGKVRHERGLDELDKTLCAITSGDSEPGGLAASEQANDHMLTRRRVLIGGGVATALATSGGAFHFYRRTKRGEVPPEVERLMLHAKDLMSQNTREGQYQAIGLYQRVVQTAPGYADGWGWLGFTYGVLSHYRERPEGMALRARAVASGSHALELDPDSAFGELALAVALPYIGHWAEREQRMTRALALRPRDEQILMSLAVLMQFVGRSTEAVPLYRRVRDQPLRPAAYSNFIRALWSAGRLPELDQAISDAASLYPTQGSLWFTRLHIAKYSGQVGTVAALGGDVQSRPSAVTDDQANRLLNVARAIQSRDKAQIDATIVDGKETGRTSAPQAEYFIRDASALGRLDEAFEFAEAYYFGRGFIIPDSSSKGSAFWPEQRQTRWLFEPATKPMRADPRFEPLVKKLGFDRYWRESGKPPDYRHVSGL